MLFTKFKTLMETSKVLSVAMFAVFATFAQEPLQRETYETDIKFNQNSSNPLTLKENKIEIFSTGSREDLASLDTEAIKGYMKFYSEQYDIDWRLVYAIGYHESANYTSSLARRNYNFFGRKAVGGGYASWNTPEEAIDNQFAYLKRRYIDRGLITPAEINRVYAEDPNWHFKVESLMASL